MKPHVYPLDAIRFVAAFGVLMFHLAFYAWSAPHSTVGEMFEQAAQYPLLAPFTWFGWIGVEIFFVVSGIVIANSANGRSPLEFTRSRALRLFPAAWICAVITLVAWLVIDGAAWPQLAVAFLHSVSLSLEGPWIDGVYWTLAIEMAFYALIFVLLALGKFQWLPHGACLLALYSSAYVLAQSGFGDALSSSSAWRFARSHEGILLLRYGCFFALGIFVWLYSVRRLSVWEWSIAAIAASCCCIEIVWRCAELSAGEVQAHLVMSPVIPVMIWMGALGFMFAVVRAPERFGSPTPLSRAFLQRTAAMTYPLYLTHSVVGAGIVRVLVENGWHKWTALAAGVAVMLALASVVAVALEPAARSMLRTVWERVEALFQTPAFLSRSGGAIGSAFAATGVGEAAQDGRAPTTSVGV